MTSPPVPPPELTEPPAKPGELAETEQCLNCGAALDGRFCAACGQEVRDPRPTTRELLHDVAGELFNWDGKLFGTLRVLATRPGFLTTEVLAGRRVRYLPPLRLYLICSVAFFALATLLPSRRQLKVRYTGAPATGSVRIRDQAGLTREERSKADAAEACRRVAADTASPSMAIRLSARAACRAQAGSDSYMPEVSSYYPKVGFVLLPIYALILSLVYHHRRYPEHLYFALHVHAFAFLMLAPISAAVGARAAVEARGGNPGASDGLVVRHHFFGGHAALLMARAATRLRGNRSHHDRQDARRRNRLCVGILDRRDLRGPHRTAELTGQRRRDMTTYS